MLPTALLACSDSDGTMVPHFLHEDDHPWLRSLLEEWERFVGRPQRELDERMREPLPCLSPARKRAIAIHVLRHLWGTRQQSEVAPRKARAALFGEAARSNDHDAVAARGRAAASLGVTAEALSDALFADLPGERRVLQPERMLSPGELALRANLALAQGLLFRAARVRIAVQGNARVLVQHAKARGLICSVAIGARRQGSPRSASDPAPDSASESASDPDAVLDVSGPLALFRHTLVYGRALAALVPLLAWCQRFRLRADCTLAGRSGKLLLGSGDPIFPAEPPRLYDSALERRFARDFRRLAKDWDIVREPEPVQSGSSLIFPDFALSHRHDPARRWLLEIVGFWTPEYVQRKLALYRQARLKRLILCIDEQRGCAEADLPTEAAVLRFRRRVDAAAVLRCIEGASGAEEE